MKEGFISRLVFMIEIKNCGILQFFQLHLLINSRAVNIQIVEAGRKAIDINGKTIVAFFHFSRILHCDSAGVIGQCPLNRAVNCSSNVDLYLVRSRIREYSNLTCDIRQCNRNNVGISVAAVSIDHS